MASTTKRGVIIVGAGFSGLIAARELESAGIEVQIYEARDRIGGRAWTDERLGGHALEMGATWVHWMQPFVWTEITRYGQEIYPSPDIEQAYWVSGGDVHSDRHELDTALARLQDRIFEGSREFFPYPHDPLAILRDESTDPELRERFLAADTGSVLDCLRDGTHTQEEIDLADSYWSAGFQGPTATASPLMAKHWAALSDHRSSLMDEQTLRFKLVHGMRGLYRSIAADLHCDITLGTPVADLHADGVRVTLADGTVDTANATIVTVPIGALRTSISPALTPASSTWWTRARTRSASRSGSRSPVSTRSSPAHRAITRSRCCAARSSSKTRTPPSSSASAPTTTRSSSTTSPRRRRRSTCARRPRGHRLRRPRLGRRPVVRPDLGHAEVRPVLQRLEPLSGVLDASALRRRDFASGWNGVVVDGAIESGIKTARKLIAEFRG